MEKNSILVNKYFTETAIMKEDTINVFGHNWSTDKDTNTLKRARINDNSDVVVTKRNVFFNGIRSLSFHLSRYREIIYPRKCGVKTWTGMIH